MKGDKPVKKVFKNLRNLVMAGLLFLLPIYVSIILLNKAWAPLSAVGKKIAALTGMDSIFGVGGSTIFSVILLVVTLLVCGLLVRFSFVAALGRAAEGWLSKNIPGYETYKALAEDKLSKGAKALPYRAALIRQQEFWQPAYIIEQDANGNYVVFLPDTPETRKGHVLLAKPDQVRVVPAVTANQLEASLKKLGRGLLSEYCICD
jgi:uncharacterized membrane protein